MVYVMIRILLALYTLASLMAVCIPTVGSYHSVMAYLTIWTYLMLTLHFWVAAGVAVFWLVKQRATHRNNSHDLTVQSQNLGYVGDKRACNGSEQNIQNGKIDTVVEKGNHNGKEGNLNQNGTHGTVTYNESIANGSSGVVDSTVNLDMYRHEDGVYKLQDTTWYMKVSWCLGNIVQNFAIIVTIVYFTVLFPAVASTLGINWDDFNMHAINTVLILFDMMICARPVRLLHFVYPILYGLAYVTFSAVYWSQDPKNNVLYPILDYSKIGLVSGVIIGLGFVVIPLFQLLNFGIYKLRLRIYYAIYGELYQ